MPPCGAFDASFTQDNRRALLLYGVSSYVFSSRVGNIENEDVLILFFLSGQTCKYQE